MVGGIEKENGPISLKHSKTDQFGQGSKIYLGRTKNDLCPVAAILAYLALRGNIQGPLFVPYSAKFSRRIIFTVFAVFADSSCTTKIKLLKTFQLKFSMV